MNFYPFHLGDYSSHTKHLSLMEDLAYRRMLDLYYTLEKPLPLEPEKVARLIGMRDHIREVSDVLSDFFLKSEDGYRNSRCDKEIDIYKAKAERAKAANNARWSGNKSDSSIKSDMKLDEVSEYDHIPTNNQYQEPLPITKTSNKNKVAAKKSPPVDLPDWIPLESWGNFVGMRKERKKPVTDRAEKMLVKKLTDMKNEGQNIAEVLDQSTRSGWSDVYPVKQSKKSGQVKTQSIFDGLNSYAERRGIKL